MVADSSSRSSPKQEVVVVGASFAGRRVAQLLSSNAGLRVTLVDRHEFWEYTPSVLRALVEPSKLACILQRHPPSQPVVVAEALEVQVEDASPGGGSPCRWPPCATRKAWTGSRSRACSGQA